MKKSVIILVCFLAGCFLPGCDFYSGYGLWLTSDESNKLTLPQIVMRNDFDTVTRIVENYANREGFTEVIVERELTRKVYQRNEKNKVYRIRTMISEKSGVISIAILEMQSRKPSKTLHKVYAELKKELQTKFGKDRLKETLIK